jgi:hypothetical protein
MSYWNENAQLTPGLEGWRESLALACRWITEVSLIRTEAHPFEQSHFPALGKYRDWRGAFRGEYTAATHKWDVFCPIWHGGQGVKALALAYETLGEKAYLEAARLGADFILRHQVGERDPDAGLILAYEDTTGINTSAVLEALDGLFAFARVANEPRYAEAAVRALRWAQRRMFLPDEGLFSDDYHPDSRTISRAGFMPADLYPQPGRPLLDDGVFLTGWQLTGDATLKDVAVRTADRLLRDEGPEGNWKAYPPSHPVTGKIHPRHAFWWGRPFWMVHRATGEPRYLDLCRRSARWYVRAMRTDGGLFRDTYGDFSTPSFGHATSGIACAAILWADLVREYGDDEWREPIRRALRFCRAVQFARASDSNLQGAILEKVLPPAGSDAPPWYLRELGTFFYVQALCQVLRDCPEALKGEA